MSFTIAFYPVANPLDLVEVDCEITRTVGMYKSFSNEMDMWHC
jgi:hypothetical protein